MKTEMFLVICFLVGVLIFYLLKQSCGCSAVVEGQTLHPDLPCNTEEYSNDPFVGSIDNDCNTCLITQLNDQTRENLQEALGAPNFSGSANIGSYIEVLNLVANQGREFLEGVPSDLEIMWEYCSGIDFDTVPFITNLINRIPPPSSGSSEPSPTTGCCSR